MRRITVAGARSRVSRARATALSLRFRVAEHWRRRGPHAALDFADWTDRRRWRGSGFPDAWRSLPDVPLAAPARVAVLLHVFYPELLAGLLAQLSAIPVEFDLIITNATGGVLEVGAAPANAGHVLVLDVENRGRDIWPMVQVVNSGLLDPYELVLKIHTKRSPWRAEHDVLEGTGDAWHDELVQAVLGGGANVERILAAFAERPDLGIVTSAASIAGPEHWGADYDNTRELLRRLELAIDRSGLRFAAGSFYWTRAFVLQGLRALQLTAADFEDEAGQIDGTTAHAIERAIGLLTREAGLQLAAHDAATPSDPQLWQRYRRAAERNNRVRLVPFYLPQFHPTPQNDRWWGAGFTEWTNVAGALPVYLGQNQPNLPGELGFYDLRLDDVRRDQTTLARSHGIEAFMYYYYWFAGQRLLDVPLERLVASDLDKSFCIMWANENWTRRWDGRVEDILIGQDYAQVSAAEFIDDVMPLLRDPRYLRVDGKPLIAIYRIAQIPDFPIVIKEWRRKALAAGVGELHILSVDVAVEYDGLAQDPASAGLDGTLGFPPHNMRWSWMPHAQLYVNPNFQGNILHYGAMVDDAQRRLLRQDPDSYPGVMVAFDNTPRRQWAPDVWYGANPYTFRRWLAAACTAVADREPDRRIVFVNAWNEWAEGAVLEPSRRFGRSYLHAVRDVLHG